MVMIRDDCKDLLLHHNLGRPELVDQIFPRNMFDCHESRAILFGHVFCKKFSLIRAHAVWLSDHCVGYFCGWKQPFSWQSLFWQPFWCSLFYLCSHYFGTLYFSNPNSGMVYCNSHYPAAEPLFRRPYSCSLPSGSSLMVSPNILEELSPVAGPDTALLLHLSLPKV